eukprot:PhF_6_TR36073/c0_g1_i1/m.52394
MSIECERIQLLLDKATNSRYSIRKQEKINVFSAKHRDSGSYCMLEICKMRKDYGDEKDAADSRVAWLNYVQKRIHFKSSDYNLGVRALGVLEDGTVYMETKPYVTDLMSIIRSKQTLTINHCIYFSYLLLLGVAELHQNGIVHGSVRPSEAFFSSNEELYLVPSCDWATIYGDLGISDQRWYIPPERIAAYEIEYGLHVPYTPKPSDDLWGIGCILYEMVHRKPLFQANVYNMLPKMIQWKWKTNSYNEEVGRIQTTEKYLQFVAQHGGGGYEGADEESRFLIAGNDSCPATHMKESDRIHLNSLLKQLLHFNPTQRGTALDAIRHPFFEELFDESDLTTLCTFQCDPNDDCCVFRASIHPYETTKVWESLQQSTSIQDRVRFMFLLLNVEPVDVTHFVSADLLEDVVLFLSPFKYVCDEDVVAHVNARSKELCD